MIRLKAVRWMLAGSVAMAFAAGCATPGGGRGSAPVFSVATYNVQNLTLMDRDRDGEDDDPKPEEEIHALVSVFRAMRADVVALQEVGGDPELADLQERIARAGLEYPYRKVLEGADEHRKLALLSRFPIVSAMAWTNETYTIDDVELSMGRGILAAEIEPRPGYRFVLVNCHLKSKRYHPQGQYEMRAREAAILRSYVSSLLLQDAGLNLVVVGDMNDTPNERPIKIVHGGGDEETAPALVDLRYAGPNGLNWTQHWEYGDVYSRFDYIFASPGMAAEVVAERGRIVGHPAVADASDHRPVQAFFFAEDR